MHFRRFALLCCALVSAVVLSLVFATAAFAAPVLSNPKPAPGSAGWTPGSRILSIHASDTIPLKTTAQVAVDGVWQNAWLSHVLIEDDDEQIIGVDETQGDVSQVRVLANGVHVVSMKVTNVANQTTTYTWTFTVGSAVATVSDLSPSNGSYVSDRSPLLSAKVSGGTVQMKLDGAVVPATVSGGVASYQCAELPDDSSHNLTVKVTGSDGQVSSAYSNFTIHAGAPQYSHMTPTLASPSVDDDTQVSVRVADGVPITSTALTVDGLPVPSEFSPIILNNTEGEVHGLATGLADGVHVANVVASNAAHTTSNESWEFLVAAAPEVTDLLPAPYTVKVDLTPTLSARVTDNSPGSLEGTFTIAGQVFAATYDPIAHTLSADVPEPLEVGIHTATLQARDVAGNVATASWTFRAQELEPMPTTGACTTCHTDYPAQHPLGVCGCCHTDGEGTPHSGVNDPEAHPMAPCTQCHNADWWGVVPSHPLEHMTSAEAQGCTGCHEDELTTEHYRRVDGNGEPLTCAACHSSTDPDVVAAIAAGDTSCTSCHELGAGGHGTTGGHPLHMSATDPRGPGIWCYDCHATGSLPSFKSGDDANGDGKISLAETDVCDECHSPGGDYDGVESIAGSVGAKDNWAEGVYESTDVLRPGKEKWCAGCHDGDPAIAGEEPSLIDGVYAPSVIGDEDGSGIYGTGWGYYKTGHGAPNDKPLPSNGGAPGPALGCESCHDNDLTHIDGERRSYDATTSPTAYREGYRLALVAGENPMEIPWAAGAANDATRARLCYQSGCHDYSAINGTTIQRTNFWLDAGTLLNEVRHYNMHEFHLDFDYQRRWVSDYSGKQYPGDSRISCPSCHNVHGSKYLAMTSDGELTSEVVDRRPGLRLWYRNSDVSTWNPNDANPPTPEDVPLTASDGWIWRPATAGNVCSHCHGANQNTRDFARTLAESLPVVPRLAWTGEQGYVADGVDPDSGTAEDILQFRVTYIDGNNDAPTAVVLRLDRNDDGDFDDVDETLPMNAVSPSDQTYFNGNIYAVSTTIGKAGDDEIAYRFEASDGSSPIAISDARSASISNAAPTLAWTGESGYADDGVTPNGGTAGVTSFHFRITYRDADGEAPLGGSPTLHLDVNDDGDFDDAGEALTMDSAGGTVTGGQRYSRETTLALAGDGQLTYYFSASDGTDTASTAEAVVTAQASTNEAPALSWTGETGYVSDGVDPEAQAGGKPFEFRVEYADSNGDAPAIADVMVDLDDDGSYSASERFAMDDVSTGAAATKSDGDYTNGEVFARIVHVPFAGDGTLTYSFDFADSWDAASGPPQDDGDPSDDPAITVFDALDVPADYPSIQAAVSAASAGDTVLVADGTWSAFAFNGRDVFVESVNGPGSTTISGGGTLVDFNNQSHSTLEGFTIQGGTTGVYSNNSNVTIRDCVVDSNSSVGINHLTGSGYELIVEDSVLSNNNRAIIGNNAGGRMTLRRTDVTDNSVDGNGGAITSNGCQLYVFEECVFSGNTASGSGGALYNVSSTFTMQIRDCVFEDNRTTGGGHGGALAFNNGTNVTIERTVFRGNRAGGHGGAVWHQGGIYNYTNVTFSGNWAGAQGGAVCMATNSGTPTFNFCTFSGNSGLQGGSLYVNWPAAGQAKVLNSIMYGNDSRSSAVLDEIDGGNYLNTRVQYTDINQESTSFNSQTGNFAVDPLFVSPVGALSAPAVTGDYHLRSGSPCVDAADPAATTALDIDRQSRPVGALRDCGSDERIQ